MAEKGCDGEEGLWRVSFYHAIDLSLKGLLTDGRGVSVLLAGQLTEGKWNVRRVPASIVFLNE
ncbi:MAG: hypothetical protein JXL84_22410 [Deltaproteobacteria bacterium]|nr:hypothetical protein [Deltaproteobacteria bacterium]